MKLHIIESVPHNQLALTIYPYVNKCGKIKYTFLRNKAAAISITANKALMAGVDLPQDMNQGIVLQSIGIITLILNNIHPRV